MGSFFRRRCNAKTLHHQVMMIGVAESVNGRRLGRIRKAWLAKKAELERARLKVLAT
jgi:hypothetical protein